MEPEHTQLCAHCLEFTGRPLNSSILHRRTISAYGTSSVSCACCHFLFLQFRAIGDKVLTRFTQYQKSALDHFPTELSSMSVQVFPSGLCVVQVEAALKLPNKFCYAFDCTVSSCNTSSPAFSATPSWQAFPTTLNARLWQTKQWLSGCEENHSLCRQSSARSLPKRLIEIDFAKAETARLVFTHDLDIASVKYTSLSYCWGDHQPVKASRANVCTLHTMIPWSLLPQTLTDAISITKALGIRYIWIDALCIVQDDESDWTTEAAKMYEVYTGSHLTIQAAESSSSAGGCFMAREASTDSRQSKPPRGFFATKDTTGNKDIRVHIATKHDLDQEHSALGRRGWCCQEAHLSRRKVKVIGSELHWQCLTECQTETGAQSVPDSLLRRKACSSALTQNYDVSTSDEPLVEWNCWWGKTMEDYSRRRFTYSHDRLAALVGLVELYGLATGDKPCLGLWRNTLSEDLAWSRYDSLKNRELDDPLQIAIPSWSPLSCRQSVKFHKWCELKPTENASEFFLSILHCRIAWTNGPFVSDVREAVLVVNGPVQEIHLSEATEINDCNPPYFNVDHEALDFENHPIPWRCAVQWDQEGSRAPRTWKCLLLARRVTTGYEFGCETFLVLESLGTVSASENCYRRVAIGALGRKRTKSGVSELDWKFDLGKRESLHLL